MVAVVCLMGGNESGVFKAAPNSLWEIRGAGVLVIVRTASGSDRIKRYT
jgi:hypothetical protein